MGESLSKTAVEPCTCCGSTRKVKVEETAEFQPINTFFSAFVKDEKKEKPVIVGDLTLSQAVFKGETGLVEATLQSFADYTKEQDVDQNTPVHWAAVKGHYEILQILIDHQFPASTKNKDGKLLSNA